MKVEEIKEKILSIERAPGLVVDCDICQISGDIDSGNFGVICDVKKSDTKKKRQYITHWHYGFTNGKIDEVSFISSSEKRLK